VERWWNDTDRGKWSIGGMILTGESGALGNDTDRGEWSVGGMVLTGESGALVE
jgi:hypothetical protein